MNNKIISNIFLLFLFNCFIHLFKCEKLRFVFELFRHGARAPYKLDKQTNIDLFGNYWVCESQLTAVGIRQHYLNGIKLRQKFFNKLNISEVNYNPQEIKIYSTNTDRTIMSAYSQIFGMFPPGTGPRIAEDSEFLNNISVPPTKFFDYSDIKEKLNTSSLLANINLRPVRIFDNTANYFDLNDPVNCPKVQPILDENEKNPEFITFVANFRKKYQDKILKIINKVETPEFLDKGWNVYKIFDTFESNYFEKRNLTKFTQEGIDLIEFKNLTNEFLFISDFVFNYGDKQKWVARYSQSPIFENLLNIIDVRIKLDKTGTDIYNPEFPKILLYSGHDTNLGAMQVFLKFAFGDKINLMNNYFASVFSFEVYQNGTFHSENKLKNASKHEEDLYFLRIYFNDIDYFGGPIIYSEFKKIVKQNLISREDINKFCGFNSEFDSESKVITIVFLVVLVVVIVGLSFWIIKIKMNKENLDENVDLRREEYEKI